MPLDVVARVFGRCEVLENIRKFLYTQDVGYIYTALSWFCREVGWNKCTMILETSIHFEEGAKKYGEYNWQKGIPVRSYIDSAIRHYIKHKRGDVDERHDRAFCWNCMCCAWTVENLGE